MELHAFHAEGLMAHSHDFSIGRFRGDLKAGRKARAIDNERLVSRGGEGVGHLPDNRPGVLLEKANRLRPASALIALDLPTLERPAKASSGPRSGGKSRGCAAESRNCACWRGDKGVCLKAEILIKSRLSNGKTQGAAA